MFENVGWLVGLLMDWLIDWLIDWVAVLFQGPGM
jgi:hypothetical protein